MQFNLPIKLSPSFYNLSKQLTALGWKATSNPLHANLHPQHFNFNPAAAEHLEYKHLLHELLVTRHPEFMPMSFTLNDYSWPNVLPYLARNSTKRWILKPSLLNNGQHIQLFAKKEQLVQYFCSPQRLGGPHVLQEYINPPDLLRGHKYTIRLFVALTPSKAYLYPHGYLNVARLPYAAHSFSDLRPHLTNEHLSAHEINVHQIPTDRWPTFSTFYPMMKKIIEQTLRALRLRHPQTFTAEANKTLALFGFDFLIDHTQRVWLLEANHGPCFPISNTHPLQEYLYHDFWRACVTDVIYPLLGITANFTNQGPQFTVLDTRS